MATKNKTTAIEKANTMIVPTAATRELTPGIWSMIEKMAPVMFKARLFGVQSTEQAAAIMLKGYELGLSMTASFEFIQVIQGRPGLSPRGALALLHSSPLIKDIKLNRLTDKEGKFVGYECSMTRTDNGFSFTSRFTMDMAKKAGLIKADSGWTKYEENMCMYRSIGFDADVVAPDVTAGMTTLMKAPEMYGVALTEGGDVVDVAPVTVPDKTPLEELLAQFPAELIMSANNNKIPATPEEIEKVRKDLLSQQEAMISAAMRD